MRLIYVVPRLPVARVSVILLAAQGGIRLRVVAWMIPPLVAREMITLLPVAAPHLVVLETPRLARVVQVRRAVRAIEGAR